MCFSRRLLHAPSMVVMARWWMSARATAIGCGSGLRCVEDVAADLCGEVFDLIRLAQEIAFVEVIIADE